MWELRQSTEVYVFVGGFFDKDDAVTEENPAATATAKLVKLGESALAARNSTTSITHLGNGHLRVHLNTVDTNTLGFMRLVISDMTTHLQVWEDFNVVAQQYWDSKYSTDLRQVDVTQVGGNAVTSADDFKASVSGLSTFDPAADTVTVGDLETAALAKYVTEDTLETVAVAGSVVKLAQGSATEATVQSAMTAQGYTTTRAPKLDYLDANISSITGGAGGSGSVQQTLVIKADDGTPIDNCLVWLTLDLAGVQRAVKDQYTNAAGEVDVMIDYDVTYYVWRQHPNWSFDDNPVSVVWSS